MPESYQFKPWYKTRRGAAAIVARELLALHESGGLTVSRLIETATPEDSPLHEQFEWDDAIAGHEFRLIQGRSLIRSISIVSQRAEDGEPGIPQSVFVHVPATPAGPQASREGKYVPLLTVTENECEYARALAELERRLDAADRAFRELRRVAEGKGESVEALAIAVQGFATVNAALALLRG